MKTLYILLFCLYSSNLFAQNGFFLQPEVGGGIGSFHQASTYYGTVPRNIFSFNATLEAGYKRKKWAFITGIGYLRTGYTTGRDGTIYYTGVPGTYPAGYGQEDIAFYSTAYNRHIIAPVKIGYQLLRLNNRLTFTAYVGAELSYNLTRVFREYSQKYDERTVESPEHFDYFGHRFSVFGLAQFNFEYKASTHIAITAGLSAHYMLTPYLRDDHKYDLPQEHDYSLLANLGMRYNFGHRN